MRRYRAVRTSSGSLAMLAAIRRALADVRRGGSDFAKSSGNFARGYTAVTDAAGNGLYIRVISTIQFPIENDLTSAVTLSRKKVRRFVNETRDHDWGSDHRSHSHRHCAWFGRYV